MHIQLPCSCRVLRKISKTYHFEKQHFPLVQFNFMTAIPNDNKLSTGVSGDKTNDCFTLKRTNIHTICNHQTEYSFIPIFDVSVSIKLTYLKYSRVFHVKIEVSLPTR